jgi:hypothetical protein
MGALNTSENITAVFNDYAFNASTELGVWSQPLKDDALYTQGGYWVAQIVAQEENKEMSTEDRTELINGLFTDWMKEISDAASSSIVNNLNDETLAWAVAKATAIIKSG